MRPEGRPTGLACGPGRYSECGCADAHDLVWECKCGVLNHGPWWTTGADGVHTSIMDHPSPNAKNHSARDSGACAGDVACEGSWFMAHVIHSHGLHAV